MQIDNIVVIIPAYKPSIRLISIVKELYHLGLKKIVIVDDGSGLFFGNIFEELKQNHCYVLNHAVNKGKGNALKTAFTFCLSEFRSINGVVTMDADGQHITSDVLNVAKLLNLNTTSLILGARKLESTIPFRSKFGNTVTKKVFALATGQKIEDTQTGLRGISINYLYQFSKLRGKKYEYEMNMLLYASKLGIKIKEVPIKTIYINNNKSSHFNPIFDSFKIYSLILRFIFSKLRKIKN